MRERKNIIIDGKQKKRKRYFEYIVTGAGWLYVTLAIFQVAATLIVWTFHVRLVMLNLVGNSYDTLSTMGFNALIALAAFFLLYVWRRYNYIKYGDMFRRAMPPDATPESVASVLNVEPELLEELGEMKWIDIETSIQRRAVPRTAPVRGTVGSM